MGSIQYPPFENTRTGTARVHQQELLSAQNLPPEQPNKPVKTDPVDGVALRRLLAVATLTPAQAGLLTLDLVDQLEESRGAGRSLEHIDDRSTIVTESGHLAPLPEIVPSDAGEKPRHPAQPDAEDATSLTHRLIANARKSGARPPAGAKLLADRVGGSFDDLPDLTRRVRRAVSEVVPLDDADEVRRIRRQLAALVKATKGNPPRQDANPFAVRHPEESRPDIPLKVSRAAVLTREDWRRVSRPVWHRKRRFATRKTILIALVVALVVALAWWVVPGAVAQLDRGWSAVFGVTETSQRFAPVSPPPEPSQRDAGPVDEKASVQRPEPVEQPGPSRSGLVTEVTVERAGGACSSGAACSVRVDVHLDALPAATTVSWSLRIVDRCSGTVRKLRGESMTAESGWRQVYGVSRLNLPKGKALAIIAVTKSPARAASEPLLVPSSIDTC